MKLIDKDALVAEIERRIKFFTEESGNSNSDIVIALFGLKSFLDTLEVKEVDLEKELDTWRHNHFHGRRDIFANGEYLERVSQLDIAKYFFELGIKTKQTTI